MPYPSYSPQVVKGALVRLLPDQGLRIEQSFIFPYNPEVLVRHFQAPADPRSPARQQLRFNLLLDATESLSADDPDPQVVARGISQELATLEALFAPNRVSRPSFLENLMGIFGGRLDSRPGHLTIFFWGAGRLMPVRLLRMNVTEELFDPSLNPLRARVDLRMQVLPKSVLPADGMLEAKFGSFPLSGE